MSEYAFGEQCTWHGPETFTDPGPVCPRCGLPVKVLSEAGFWEAIQANDRGNPGYEAMMRWSQGKCFPDFDTLENAYRQAMEGQN